jgi:hypothetical protein
MRRRDQKAWLRYRIRFAAVCLAFFLIQCVALLPLFTVDGAGPWMVELAVLAAAVSAAGNLYFGTKLGQAKTEVEDRRAERSPADKNYHPA